MTTKHATTSFTVVLIILGLTSFAEALSLARYVAITKGYAHFSSQYEGFSQREFNNIKLLTETYISGLASGAAWMNAELKSSGNQLLYCREDTRQLTIEDAMKILNQYLQTHLKDEELRAFGEQDVGKFFVQALKETFPCTP